MIKNISTFNFRYRLDINPVLAKDEGLYECQVNTRDKMSLVFKLNVARKYTAIHF